MVYRGQNVVLSGDLHLDESVNIWHNAVLRGDTAPITIAANTNVQDLCMLHAGDGYPITIGQNVTIGHMCILHGCTIDDHVLVGMGSIIMNGAHIPEYTIIAAGSLIPQHKVYPNGYLLMGRPAKAIRPLTQEEKESIATNARHYEQMALCQLLK